jgi:hypothetical protein
MLAACWRRNVRRRVSPLRHRPKTCFEQHLAHRRRRHANPESLELADEPLVSPVRVFAREPHDEFTDRTLARRSPGFPMGVRPAARDELPVPAQQYLRFDGEVRPSGSRHRATQRSQQRHGSVAAGHPAGAAPPTRDAEAGSQLFRAPRPRQQPHQREQIPDREIHERLEQATPPSTDGKTLEPS